MNDFNCVLYGYVAKEQALSCEKFLAINDFGKMKVKVGLSGIKEDFQKAAREKLLGLLIVLNNIRPEKCIQDAIGILKMWGIKPIKPDESRVRGAMSLYEIVK